MSRSLKHNKRGFTLVELMIAATAFSIVLLGASSALIQIGRMYFKGYLSGLTQQTARSVMDTVSRQIQFGGSTVSGEMSKTYDSGTPNQLDAKAYCVGTQRYTFVINRQVSDEVPSGTVDQANSRVRHALWRDIVSSAEAATCEPVDLRQAEPSVGKEGVELLGVNMRLKEFVINEQVGTNQKLWNVTVAIMYGDDDLINFTDPGNKTGPIDCAGLTGSQWCSLSELNTQVLKRLR